MPTPGELEIAAHSLLTLLGVWLGVTVAVRARSSPGRLFAMLSLTLAAWSAAVIVERLAPDPGVDRVARAVQEIGIIPVIPVVAHISVAASVPRLSRGQRAFIALTYALNLLVTLPAILDPQRPIRVAEPRFELDPLPAAVLFAAWVVVRVGTMVLTAAWLLVRLHQVASDPARMRQVGGLLATVVLATVGGGMRMLPVVGESDPWIGITLVTVSMLCAAWTVFSTGAFLSPAAAGQAFWGTLAAGLVVAVLAALLVAADQVSRRVLGVEMPVLGVAVLMAAAALHEPVAAWVRRRRLLGAPRRADLQRLLHVLGDTSLAPQAAGAGVRPALERLAGTLEVPVVTVRTAGGEEITAGPGTPPPGDHPASTVLPLVADGEHLGELRVGLPDPAAPRADPELLALAAHYLAAALRAQRSEHRQLAGLDELGRERAVVERAAAQLDALLDDHASRARDGLVLHVLGPMRAERAGQPVERWGGDKAGSRQAQALFAFLLDRGEHGVTKDEAIELAWPEMPLDRADLAFHRTLSGLRSTLADGGDRNAIRHRNGRYRLDPSVVTWTDADELERLADAAGDGTAGEPEAALRHARALYRGEYLDDCPLYGDSSWVEARRGRLRERYAELLVTLGERAEADGRRAVAVAAYREARAASDGVATRADAGLERLGYAT